MKKFIYLMALMFTLSCINANAQDRKRDGEGKKFDRTEMMKKRVDRMAEHYGLDEKQKEQLLELNKKYVSKMAPNGMRPRRMGRKADGHNNSDVAERPSKEQMEAMRAEMKKNREEYEAELKKIMTSEQYAVYEQDLKERRSNFDKANQRSRKQNKK